MIIAILILFSVIVISSLPIGIHILSRDDTIKIYFNEDNINLIARTKKTVYKGILEIDNAIYEDKKNKLSNIEGTYYNYTIGDSYLTEEYRISNFENQELYNIITDISLSKSLNSMKSGLTSAEYICE